MKKLFFLIPAFLLLVPMTAKAIDTELFSISFQSALAKKSPLSPPERFADSLNPLIDSAPYNASVNFREKMRGKKMAPKELKGSKDQALKHIGNVKNLIESRQKRVEANIIDASQTRLDFLSNAANNDLKEGLIQVNKERAALVARADVDKKIAITVLDIKMKTDLANYNQAINQAKARLKKGGLSASARQKIINSINSLTAKKDALLKKWASEKGKINNDHAEKIKAADAQLTLDNQAVNNLYDQNLDIAEKSVNDESKDSIYHLNKQVYLDTKKLDSLKNSLERVLTGSFNRIVQLGGSQTPKVSKPKKQKVNKKKKQAAKKKAAKKAREAAQKYLKEYRDQLYSDLD
jgi:hypothetical protein